MGPMYGLMALVFVWVLVSTAMQFYKMFHTMPCPDDAAPQKCLRPLFADGELVSVYTFLTEDPKLRWWSKDGFRELQRTLFWNATSIPYGENIPAVTRTVPLSSQQLLGVRQNSSAVHSHCFLIRDGLDLEEELRDLDPSKVASTTLTSNLLHATAQITRLQQEVQRSRRNLLSNSSDSDGSESRHAPPVTVTLPVFSHVVRIFPSDALMWTGSIFIVSAFFPASRVVAVVRHFVLVALTPWLIHLRTQQMELWKDEQRRRQKEEELSLWNWASKPKKPHMIPIVRISIAVDTQSYDASVRPPLLYKEMIFDKHSPMPVAERDVRYDVFRVKGVKRYAPPFSIDTWGVPQRQWRALDSNASKPDPEVNVEIDVTGVTKYSVFETFRQSLKMYLRMGFTERDFEDIKDFFFRYPLHIMATMQLLGFVQMTLTTLAFKNDISFFRGRSDYTGLSSRSLATDTLQEIIIFLYLYDFDDISRIVLFQVGTSSLISGWKYVRVARLSIYWKHFLPWVFQNRGLGALENEQNTEEIDAKGMRYLTFVLYPLSAAWGIYNLYHYSYKSWWSWLVSSLADFAYTFGFINMMPQIFINYKLKSVAHMPWRVLMYKFFNTFIDDVFAFFIMSDHMTKKHRYMTLRDDIVFFVFLYQRYIYKIDTARPDEFGYIYEDGPKEDAALTPGSDSTAALPAGAEQSTEASEDTAKGSTETCEASEGLRQRQAAAQ